MSVTSGHFSITTDVQSASMNNPKTTMYLEPTEVRGKWFEVTDLGRNPIICAQELRI
jgi:hypothetical protein